MAILKPVTPSLLQRGYPINRGLVGAWLLTEGAGNKAYDSSSYARTLTASSTPVWVGSPAGQAINSNSAWNFSQSFSYGVSYGFPLSFFIRFYMPSTSIHGILLDDGGNNAGSENQGFAVGIGNGNGDTNGQTLLIPMWGVSWNGTGQNLAAGWHDVLFGINTSKQVANLFVDGVSISPPGATMNTPTFSTMTIGSDNDPGSRRYWPGYISDVRIWNCLLTQPDAAYLYQASYDEFRSRPRVDAWTLISSDTLFAQVCL